MEIFLAAGDPFVVGYPFLPWRHHAAAGGAPARASVPQFVAIRIWILRSAFGPNPADANMARQCSVLTIAFSAAAWSRWLTELAASGLLANAPFARLRDSDTAMASITLANPTQLDILAADYLAVDGHFAERRLDRARVWCARRRYSKRKRSARLERRELG